MYLPPMEGKGKNREKKHKTSLQSAKGLRRQGEQRGMERKERRTDGHLVALERLYVELLEVQLD